MSERISFDTIYFNVSGFAKLKPIDRCKMIKIEPSDLQSLMIMSNCDSKMSYRLKTYSNIIFKKLRFKQKSLTFDTSFNLSIVSEERAVIMPIFLLF